MVEGEGFILTAPWVMLISKRCLYLAQSKSVHINGEKQQTSRNRLDFLDIASENQHFKQYRQKTNASRNFAFMMHVTRRVE